MLVSAVPSIRTPAGKISDRTQRMLEKENKRGIKKLVDTHHHDCVITNVSQPLILRSEKVDTIELSKGLNSPHEEEKKSREPTISQLQQQLENLDSELAKRDKILSEREKQIEGLCTTLKQRDEKVEHLSKLIEDLKEVELHQSLKKAESLLADRFSQAQINIMLNKKKKTTWSSEDLSKAYTLRYFSKSALDYTINTLKLPLPSASSLERHASYINMRRGFFHEVLQLLKVDSLTKSSRDRVCILMYDEMAVATGYEYDKKEDDVVGPHSKMQVR